MLSLIVYLIAGLIVGWQVLQSILWAIWGAPTSPIQYVALIGAGGLDLAGILAIKRKKASVIMAALGLLGLWGFYIPAIYQTLHPAPNVFYEPSVFVAPSILLGATVYFGFDLFRYFTSTKPELPAV